MGFGSRVDRNVNQLDTLRALGTTFDAIPDPAYLLEVETGPRFRIVALNEACAKATGMAPERVIGHYIDDVTQDAAESSRQYARAVESQTPIRYTRSVLGAGGTMQLEVTATPVQNALGRSTHVLCITKDITEVSIAAARFDRSERLGRAVIDSLQAPLAVVDVKGRLVTRNASWVLTARNHAEGCWNLAPGESFIELCKRTSGDPALGHRFAQGVTDVTSGVLRSFVCEYRTAAESPSWWRCSVVPLSLDEGGAVVSFTDITESKTTEAELSHAATHDSLTGLPNRELFHRQLDEALGTPDQTVAVAFVDVDEFKAVNDHFGHEVGDSLLCQIAGRLRKVVRGWDTVARYAGDEFIILLRGWKSEERLEECGARIIDAFSTPFELAECELEVGVSVGLAAGRAGATEGSLIVRRADEAMYRAKNAGKNRFHISHR